MDFTTWFIILGTIVILGVDAVLIIKNGKKASISDHIVLWSHKWPVIAFAWGFLMGHFYGH